jgi:hypothetical protein
MPPPDPSDAVAYRRWKNGQCQPWTPLHRALTTGDVGYVIGYCAGAYDVDVTAEHAAAWCQRAAAWAAAYLAAADWRMWLKNRVSEAGYLDSSGGGSPVNINLPVALHVGFLYLEETPEHLTRLRRNKTPVPDTLATPGITRTAVILRPIDRVAARVVGPDD